MDRIPCHSSYDWRTCGPKIPDRIRILEMLLSFFFSFFFFFFFVERGKPEYPEKNLFEQGREPTANSTHIWRRVTRATWWEVLSPLRYPCFPMLHPFGHRGISHASQFGSHHCPLSERPEHCYYDCYTFWWSIYNLSTTRATKDIRSFAMLSCCCVYVQLQWFQWLSTCLEEVGLPKIRNDGTTKLMVTAY